MPTPCSRPPISTVPPARVLAGSDHPVVRRYSAARRNLLPRDDLVVAVAGRWAHLELLRLGGRIEVLLHGADADEVLVQRLGRVAETRALVSTRTLARLSPDRDPSGLLSLVRLGEPRAGLLARPLADLVLVADGVANAGNLGTLVRTADACGAVAVMLTGTTARITHPQVFVASRATVLTLPVLRRDDPAAAYAELITTGWQCVVADPAAPAVFTDRDYRGRRVAVVVGSERHGVDPSWRARGTERVSIPMLGCADSLNVAVSAAMLLAEVRRQHSASTVEP